MPAIFPKWMNALPTVGALVGGFGLATVVAGFWVWATPKFWEVGYMPTQPGTGFNHQLHAGKLGLDCRYCHTKVEVSPEANIPNVATCMGCHTKGYIADGVIVDEDVKLQFVRDAYEHDESIPWRRVHKLPDYVRNFPHDVHVRAGVSCFSCHGQITAMPIVTQVQPLSMSWCLDCHRQVEEARQGKGSAASLLVGREHVTSLKWVEEQWMANPAAHEADARRVLEGIKRAPPENCGACHY